MIVYKEERFYDYYKPYYQYWKPIGNNLFQLIKKDCDGGEKIGLVKEFNIPESLLEEINLIK